MYNVYIYIYINTRILSLIYIYIYIHTCIYINTLGQDDKEDNNNTDNNMDNNNTYNSDSDGRGLGLARVGGGLEFLDSTFRSFRVDSTRFIFRGSDRCGWKPSSSSNFSILFELVLLSRLDKRLPVEQSEATASQSTVPSPPLN